MYSSPDKSTVSRGNEKVKILNFSLTRLQVLFILMPFSGSVLSQGTALEEVVVTASKLGAVSLQDTAGSITALTSDTLEKTQVEGFEDYIKMVPGLTSVSSGTGQSQIVIRGVNSSRVIHSSAQIRALAGLYIDEMPISLAGFNPDLGVIDVERIEVLRGPQGTLYGASSMAGTIRVITKQPDTEEFSGSFGADTSWTKDGEMNWGVKGAINVPITENVAGRLSLYNITKGGFIDNVAPGLEQEDYNDQDTFGGRAQLAYYGDKLEVQTNFMWNKLSTEGRPDEYLPDPTSPFVSAVTDELQTVKVIPDTYNQDFLGLNLNIEYDFGPVKLVSASSAFDVEISNRLDDAIRVAAVTPVVAPFSDFRNNERYRTKIEEIRLSSNYESKLQWVIGGFYEANRRKLRQTQPTPGLNAFFAITLGGIPPCPTLTSPCFGAVTNSVFDGTESVKTDQYAAFGEATYSFTDALRLKLGFRYFDYKNEVSIFGSGVANGGVSLDQSTLKEDDWVPKVEVSYDISEDHMVYGTYSEGFRLGGVNGFVPPVCGAEVAALGSTVGAPFLSDSLTNYEIGAKTSWLDNRLTANLAVYVNEFDEIQSDVNLACGFFQRLNAGKIENVGVEGDFAFQATDAISMTFGFSYIDSEVKEAIPLVNSEGDEAPYVPEFSASGSVEYGVPVWDGFGFIRADVRHVGSSGNEFSSRPTLSVLPSYTIVDLNLGYDYNDWSFGIFARNLFDETVVTNIDPDRVQPDQLTRGIPRTVGLSVTRRF